MNYTDFKKQAAGEGYRNPLLGASNSIKNKAPLLTSPTKQDKSDFMYNWNKAPAQKKMDWFQGSKSIDPQFKTPFEQSPSEFVQADLANKATAPFKNRTTTDIQQVQQQQPKQQIQQQGTITRSVYPMGVGANRTANPAELKQPEQKRYTVAPDALKDPESVKKWLAERQGMVRDNTSLKGLKSALNWKDELKGLTGIGTISDEGQIAAFQKFKEENPQFMPSFTEAIKNGSPEAIKELQNFAKSGNGGAGMFSDEEIQQITGAAKTASWNAIKSNPIENLPKVMGLFLRQQGWDKAAGYAENPMVFYGSLLTALVGGGAMLFGGSDRQQQPVVNNYYYGNQQQPMGFGTLPARA